jgi:hypothetical protein
VSLQAIGFVACRAAPSTRPRAVRTGVLATPYPRTCPMRFDEWANSAVEHAVYAHTRDITDGCALQPPASWLEQPGVKTGKRWAGYVKRRCRTKPSLPKFKSSPPSPQPKTKIRTQRMRQRVDSNRRGCPMVFCRERAAQADPTVVLGKTLAATDHLAGARPAFSPNQFRG